MATVFEPSFSASTSLRGLNPLYATSTTNSSNIMSSSTHHNNSSVVPPLSMADSLPSINFGFDELRERMARFTVRFDAFIETGRRRVLEERNQFRMNVAELQEDARLRARDIAALHAKSHQHATLLGKEAAETAEMQTAITALTTTLAQHTATRTHLLAQLAATRTRLAQRQAARTRHAAALAQHARHDAPELACWTAQLGLRVEGVGVGVREGGAEGAEGAEEAEEDDDAAAAAALRFVFVQLDERDGTREAAFVLDCGRREYAVRRARPRVSEERVRALVEALNESGGELAPLLKGMRELFVEAMKG